MEALVIATKNKNKVKEIKDILKDLPIEITSLDDLNIDVDVVEDMLTFEDNAYKKAKEIARITGMTALADDSGLEVDALNGAPGVLSARFAGMHGDDKKNNEKLLQLMEGVPEDNRTARFVSAIAVVYPDGKKIVTRGEVEGLIGHELIGENGFGYDPLFVVQEYGKSFGELPNSIKNKISHRGRALEKLKEELSRNL